MRALLVILNLLISISSYALDISTENYDAKFHDKYSNSRNQDTACVVKIFSWDKSTFILISAEGTARWISLELPNEKLPLEEEEEFTLRNRNGHKKVTYKNGRLSYKIKDLNRDMERSKIHDIGTLLVSPDLSSVKQVVANKVSIERVPFFDFLKTVDLMRVRCYFD